MDSCVDNTKTIMNCRRSLNEMAKHYRITLIQVWVAGHQDRDGNCIADELARKGTTVEILQGKDTIGMPLATCRLFIQNKDERMLPTAKSPNRHGHAII